MGSTARVTGTFSERSPGETKTDRHREGDRDTERHTGETQRYRDTEKGKTS